MRVKQCEREPPFWIILCFFASDVFLTDSAYIWSSVPPFHWILWNHDIILQTSKLMKVGENVTSLVEIAVDSTLRSKVGVDMSDRFSHKPRYKWKVTLQLWNGIKLENDWFIVLDWCGWYWTAPVSPMMPCRCLWSSMPKSSCGVGVRSSLAPVQRHTHTHRHTSSWSRGEWPADLEDCGRAVVSYRCERTQFAMYSVKYQWGQLTAGVLFCCSTSK